MKKIKNYKQALGLALALFFIANPSFATITETNQSGGFSNSTIFYVLVVLAIVLLIGIFFLTNSVRDLMQSEFYKKKIYEEEKKKRNDGKTIISTLLILVGIPFISSASSAAPAEAAIEAIDYPLSWVWMMVIINCILLVVVFYIRNLFFQILRSVKPKKMTVKDGKEVEVKEPSKITQILTDVVPIDREHEIMMDHEYDGIHELDNNLPPWWLWSFYASIVFAVVYLFNYHVIGTGDLQEEEYNKAVAQHELEIEEYLKTQKLNVDESSVVLLTEASDLSKGQGIFSEKCAACHGKQGEGIIGPNLTDDYWIHGGDIKSVFKLVKYGNSSKGMQSWKDDLSAVEMQQVSSFIKSIKGTAVGIGKEPQGDLFQETIDNVTDTTLMHTDSIVTALVE